MKKLLGALVCVLFVSLAHAGESKQLTIYNWADYIPQSVYQQFTKETGIAVQVSNYDSNQAMYSKLKLLQKSDSGESFDLIGPSTYYVQRMAKEGMLQTLDHKKLPNLGNLEAEVLNRPYDPGNQYCIPYVLGSTAIGINREAFPKEKITRWQDLWDPKWEGQILLTDDPREVFQMALSVLKLNPNSRDPDEIKKAFEYLKKLMPNVLLFNADTPRMPYLSGDVSLGMLWSDGAFKAHKVMPSMEFIYPEEGAIFWSDTLAIPKNAKHVDAAYKFLNFILRPDIAAKILADLGEPLPNKAMMDWILDNAQKAKANQASDPKNYAYFSRLEQIIKSPILYPSKAIITKGHFQEDVGDKATLLYQKYWQLLKAGQ